MDSAKRKFEPKLFPPVFKLVGGILLILAFLPLIFINSSDWMNAQKELMLILIFNAIILGLLFLAWSKDKVEDEMTISLRLKAMSLAFIFGILYTVFMPLLEYWFAILYDEPLVVFSSQQLILTMLIFYLIIFYLQKLRR
jgi:uncharacterized membrane protein SirB2